MWANIIGKVNFLKAVDIRYSHNDFDTKTGSDLNKCHSGYDSVRMCRGDFKVLVWIL